MSAIIEASPSKVSMNYAHTDRHKHILELLTVRQPRPSSELAASLRISNAHVLTILDRLEGLLLVRRITKGSRRKGHHGPSTWSLRCHRP